MKAEITNFIFHGTQAIYLPTLEIVQPPMIFSKLFQPTADDFIHSWSLPFAPPESHIFALLCICMICFYFEASPVHTKI